MSAKTPEGSLPKNATGSGLSSKDGTLRHDDARGMELQRGADGRITESPQRVLLVEPSHAEATRLYHELVARKFEVYIARDVITAMHALSIFQPNIVLAQMRLNTYGGMELLRRTMEDPATPAVPVILYGDCAMAGERVRCLRWERSIF